MGLNMKPIEEVKQEFVETLSDRQLNELILDQTATLATMLKLNQRLEENVNAKEKLLAIRKEIESLEFGETLMTLKIRAIIGKIT